MRVYISRLGLVTGMLGAILACAMSIVLAMFFYWISVVPKDVGFSSKGAEIDPWLMLICCVVPIGLLSASVGLLRSVIAQYRWGKRPVIAFDENALSYTLNFRDTTNVEYSKIIEVAIETMPIKGATLVYLKIRKSDSTADEIFIDNFDTSIEKIFAAFKSSLPSLIELQPDRWWGITHRLVRGDLRQA